MFFYLKKKNEEKRNVDHDRNEDHPYNDSFNNSYSDVYNGSFNESYDDSHQFNDSVVSDVVDTCDDPINTESRYLRHYFGYYQSQPAITYSKLIIETLEQGVKYVKVNNKDTRTTPVLSFWCLYC